jgi:multidrug efflux pump subunit AcrB
LAVDATAEVGPATNFATFAIMAVFGAMIVLTDVQSEYFFPITIDVPIAMGASLLVAYLVTPWAARRWLRADSLGGRLDLALDAARIRKVRDDIIRNIRARLPAAALEQLRSVGAEWRSGPAAPRGLYDRLLCRLLDRGSARRLLWLLLVGGVTLSLLQPLWQFLRPQGVAGAVSPLGVGVTFLPRYESDTFSIQVDGPESAPVQQTDRVSREISRVLRAVPEVDHYIVTVGAAGPPDHRPSIRILLGRISNVRSIPDPALTVMPMLVLACCESPTPGASQNWFQISLIALSGSSSAISGNAAPATNPETFLLEGSNTTEPAFCDVASMMAGDTTIGLACASRMVRP